MSTRQIRHGTHNAYNYHRCRCDLCRAFTSAYYRRYVHSGRWRLPTGEVDEVAVERAVRGDRTIRLNRAEQWAAFGYLDGHGYSARMIAERVGVSERTVVRWRSRTPGEQAC